MHWVSSREVVVSILMNLHPSVVLRSKETKDEELLVDAKS